MLWILDSIYGSFYFRFYWLLIRWQFWLTRNFSVLRGWLNRCTRGVPTELSTLLLVSSLIFVDIFGNYTSCHAAFNNKIHSLNLIKLNYEKILWRKTENEWFLAFSKREKHLILFFMNVYRQFLANEFTVNSFLSKPVLWKN